MCNKICWVEKVAIFKLYATVKLFFRRNVTIQCVNIVSTFFVKKHSLLLERNSFRLWYEKVDNMIWNFYPMWFLPDFSALAEQNWKLSLWVVLKRRNYEGSTTTMNSWEMLVVISISMINQWSKPWPASHDRPSQCLSLGFLAKILRFLCPSCIFCRNFRIFLLEFWARKTSNPAFHRKRNKVKNVQAPCNFCYHIFNIQILF